MQGDIVTAAKWLSGGLVVAALVCVVGFHPMVTCHKLRVEKIEPGTEVNAPPPTRTPDKIEYPKPTPRTYSTYR